MSSAAGSRGIAPDGIGDGELASARVRAFGRIRLRLRRRGPRRGLLTCELRQQQQQQAKASDGVRRAAACCILSYPYGVTRTRARGPYVCPPPIIPCRSTRMMSIRRGLVLL